MNSIFEIISAIITLILLFFFKKELEEKEEEVLEENSSVTIALEEINGIYYAWEKEKNKFLIQSKQVDEIIEHIKQIFPGKNFTIISNKEIEWLRKQPN